MNKSKLFIIISALAICLSTIASPIASAQVTSEDERDIFIEGLGKQDIPPYYNPYSELAPVCGISASLSEGGGDTVMNGEAVAKDFTLGTDNAMRAVNLVKQLMVDYSLTAAQASGIVGNFMWESGGAHLPPDINESRGAGPPAFRGGYGWAQWTGGRQVAFINYAIQFGYMTSKSEHANDAANYAWLRYELAKTERGTIPAVAKTSTPTEAATAFEHAFERAGKPVLNKRIEMANKVFEAVSNGTPLDNTAGGDTNNMPAQACELMSQGLSTKGQVFDDIVFPLAVESRASIVNRNIFVNNTTARAGHGYVAFDILAPAGTQVVAMAKGVVADVKSPAGRALGGSVTVWDEQKNIHVFYTHMSPTIGVGTAVTPGTPLGTLLSVKQYPSINADHLHIDAGPGKVRQSCSRTNLSGGACKNRIDIGPDLYNAFQTLPEGSGDRNKAV